MEEDDDVRADIQEKYLYVLIDEHQDSSGIQNEFLQKVWGGVEKPNIFVVGDDRQLIYGFGGASLQYFEGFKHSFGKAKLITLIDNYRSTQVILDASELLLQSSLSKEKLISHSKETHPIRLVECDYPRDEIIACALDIKEKIEKGLNPNNCAILVPKNKQVRSAVAILRDMNLPVSAYGAARLFDAEDTELLLRILKIISDPYDNVALAESFFDKSSGIDPLFAHKFIKEHDMKNLSLINLSEERTPTLFREDNTVSNWIKKLLYFLKESQTRNVYSLIQLIGDEFLIGDAKDHNTLISRIEIIRTMLHLALSQIEKNPKLTLKEFLSFMERLYSYDENIPLAVFNADEGIKVLTLHSSKGLEFDFVWIAHMDERSLNSQKKQGFTLPESIKERLETRDEEVIKRQLYVAITRAKRFCTISYALHSYTGGDQELAHVVADLPESIFKKETSRETEQAILEHNPRAYTGKFLLDKETSNANIKPFNLVALTDIVSKEYVKRNVSVSLLNNFFECPWKWYFRNLLQLPGMKSESLEFGNAVHACIDRILKIKNKLTKLELEKIVEGEILKREFGDDKNQKQRQKEVFNIVSKWVENRLPQIKLERENEKSISIKDDKFSHLSIYGKIDLVEKLDSNNVRVTDFKTGSVRKKSEIEKEDEEGRMSGYLRQLAMYSYLIRESTKQKVDVRESRLEFLEAKDEKEAIFDRVIGDKEIVLLIKDIVDYDSLIKSGKWVERECHYNSYGKNSECEYCKMAKMYTEIYK